jgi:hypothetical protein
MEPVLGFCHLSLTGWAYFKLPEIGDASGQCHLWSGFKKTLQSAAWLEMEPVVSCY